ncbi:MAG: CarD family transcriptional regulator [Thermaerobacter sp.]|nr:CarD family transcriptional regulator [Bacillota bacterium]REJ38074.1 MAG: CarD family transcriptional regulator [Bacillota bacterium]
MFKVGDKVVYPMHGAGVIEAIEEKEVLGERKTYYIMRLPIGDMTVMIPTDGAEEIGIREVVDEEQLERVFSILRAGRSHMSSNWNRRYRANTEKLKTGDIYEVAEVVRNLSIRDQEKGLSTGERKMLDNARQILISELVLARGLSEDDAQRLLDEVLSRHSAQAQDEAP